MQTTSPDPTRNTELTQHELDQFLDCIENGCPVAQAAGLVGISRRTIYKWLSEGRTAEGREDRKEFAKRFDEIKASFRRLSLTEAMMILENRALEGNVQALKEVIRLKTQEADEKEEQSAKPVSTIDQLAARRKARA